MRCLLWFAETSGVAAGVDEIAEVTDRPTYERMWQSFRGSGAAPELGFHSGGIYVIPISPELNNALTTGQMDLSAGVQMAPDPTRRQTLDDFMRNPVTTTAWLRAPVVPLNAEASAVARGAAELPGWRVVSSENDEALAGYWAELGRATGGALHGRPMAPGFVDYHTRTIYLPPAGRANAR